MSAATTSPRLLRLSEDDRLRAWRSHFAFAIDDVPDSDLMWERSVWGALGFPTLAALCDDELRSRDDAGLTIPSVVQPRDLDHLWRHLDHADVLGRVLSDGQSLVTAMRLAFWLRAQERGAR